MRLHIDGEVVGKKAMSSLFNKDSISSGLTKIILSGGGGDDNSLQGYIHNHKVLPLTSCFMEYYAKVCISCTPCDSLRDYFKSCHNLCSYARTHLYNFPLINHLLLRLKKAVMVFGVLLVARLV